MKKFIYSIILSILVSGVTVNGDELPEFPFVFANGKAETSVAPNIATVTFSVLQFDENEMNALEVIRTRSAELIDFFGSLKIEKEDVIAYEIDKKAIRDRKEYVELKILGYEISRRFSVKLRDINNYDKLVKKIISLKNVTDIKTDFDRTDRDKIEAELITKASRNAKEEAELMAKGFGVKLGPVFAISQQGFNRLDTIFTATSYGYAFSIGGVDRMEDFLFIPSTITINNSVTAIFRLEVEQSPNK